MKIVVQKVSGESSSIDIKSDGALADLRKAIEATEMVPRRYCYSLAFGEVSLDSKADSSKLSALGIGENAVVNLVEDTMSLATKLAKLTRKSVNEDRTRELTMAEWEKQRSVLLSKILSECRDRANKRFDNADVKLFTASADMRNEVRYGLNNQETLGSQVTFLRRKLTKDLEDLGFTRVAITAEACQYVAHISWQMKLDDDA
mmetsp:Transcript_144628/g.250845  ORF Transcript_144628/g.250845 Transcript_144628/m.250845 type:complete len:203 (-) Transcript_144628:52-660(-)